MYFTIGSQLRNLSNLVTATAMGLLPSLIVDLIAITRGVDNVQPQFDPILFNDCRPVNSENFKEEFLAHRVKLTGSQLSISRAHWERGGLSRR